MKSSLNSGFQGASSRRQPTRSVRTTANRPSNYYAKASAYRHSGVAQIENDPPTPTPPAFFPAISFFTDALTALPNEMQKHFTMLKETEGKLHQPDQAVDDLVDAISKLSEPARVTALDQSQAYMHLSLANSISGSAAASVVNEATPRWAHPSVDVDNQAQRTISHDSHLEQREDLFIQLIGRLKEMTSVLDEKNMILSAANDTLTRQLLRLDSAMPHIENELSDEARLGSNTHWALPHMKELRRTNPVGPSERGRRDVTNVNNLAAAAAVVHEGEIAATRSEARREAMLAKRSRAREPDSDVDERTTSRKHLSGKARKGQDNVVESKSAPGAQPQKRRRVEKAPAGERALSAALGGRLGGTRASPRGSPAPDANRKKPKPLPNATGPRKRATANPSSLASSPTRSNFATSSNRAHSPARQQTSRARQASVQNLVNESANNRRPSSASSARKTNATSEATAGVPGKLPQANAILDGRAPGADDGVELLAPQSVPPGVNGGPKRRESVKNEKPDVAELKQIGKAEDAPTPPVGRHSRAASRSSKPATPLTTAFNDGPPLPPPRSTRNGGINSTNAGSPTTGPSSPRRSHKKGGNGVPAVARGSPGSSEEIEDAHISRKSAARDVGDAAGDTAGEDLDENDENEPRYCTCNRVSFGDMIACDNLNCPTEWFHYECMDLTRPPTGKWFCSERCRREASARRGK